MRDIAEIVAGGADCRIEWRRTLGPTAILQESA
jgi:hypothetical protein